jgi:hypothetical protein
MLGLFIRLLPERPTAAQVRGALRWLACFFMLNCWIRAALFCFSSNCLTWITAGGSDNNAKKKKRNNVLWQQLCFVFSIWTIHNSLASFPCVQWQTGPAGRNQLRSYCFLGGKHTQTPKHRHRHTHPIEQKRARTQPHNQSIIQPMLIYLSFMSPRFLEEIWQASREFERLLETWKKKQP